MFDRSQQPTDVRQLTTTEMLVARCDRGNDVEALDAGKTVTSVTVTPDAGPSGQKTELRVLTDDETAYVFETWTDQPTGFRFVRRETAADDGTWSVETDARKYQLPGEVANVLETIESGTIRMTETETFTTQRAYSGAKGDDVTAGVDRGRGVETDGGWNSGKNFDTEYDTVIAKEDDDGSWSLRKANYHVIENFGSGEDAKQRCTGHGHGIANDVIVEESDTDDDADDPAANVSDDYNADRVDPDAEGPTEATKTVNNETYPQPRRDYDAERVNYRDLAAGDVIALDVSWYDDDAWKARPTLFRVEENNVFEVSLEDSPDHGDVKATGSDGETYRIYVDNAHIECTSDDKKGYDRGTKTSAPHRLTDDAETETDDAPDVMTDGGQPTDADAEADDDDDETPADAETLATLRHGGSVTFADRSQTLTVETVRVKRKTDDTEVTVLMTGPRGGEYRYRNSDREHTHTVARDASEWDHGTAEWETVATGDAARLTVVDTGATPDDADAIPRFDPGETLAISDDGQTLPTALKSAEVTSVEFNWRDGRATVTYYLRSECQDFNEFATIKYDVGKYTERDPDAGNYTLFAGTVGNKSNHTETVTASSLTAEASQLLAEVTETDADADDTDDVETETTDDAADDADAEAMTDGGSAGRLYYCPTCQKFRKSRTDGRREYCAVCGAKTKADRHIATAGSQ